MTSLTFSSARHDELGRLELVILDDELELVLSRQKRGRGEQQEGERKGKVQRKRA
jgi:hypothetical protein